MNFRHLILLIGLLMIAFSAQELQAQGKPEFSGYEYYVTDGGDFGLYKPKGWRVSTQKYPNGKMVFVGDPKDLSFANMTFLENIDPKLDSVAFAGETLRNMNKQMPDLKILEARSSRDRMHTVLRYQRSGLKNTPIEGKYTFNVKRPNAVVLGYEAPSKQFKEMVPTLLTIITNITVLDDQKYQKLASPGKEKGPMALSMRQTSATDGTASLLVPEGWKFTAGKGQTLCTSAREDSGYIYAVIGFVAKSRIPYFNSANIPGLHYEYMPPIDALITASRHSGATNHRVIERYSNQAWANQASAYLKKKVDAELALISVTNKHGLPCTGYYDVFGSPPDNAGQWGIIVTGIWAPTSQFGQQLPSLIKIAESYRLNEQWAAEYVRQGMARVRELMKKTSSMMSRYADEMRQSSLASHQNRMKSGDFISYKFSTYMRGEQEWVTKLEGGQVYTTDHWGLSVDGRYVFEGPPFNYYNYQGDVKYGHIPVDSSREVYEAVKGQ
ncbi:MAG: hypothetical protein QG552_2489 [Thermodesulfobacteriota bacterium]|nr:hypothetical protein [Thermodesulfobacteriota bacterium]